MLKACGNMAVLLAGGWSVPVCAVQVVGTSDFAGVSLVQPRGVNAFGPVVGDRTVNGVTERFNRPGDSFEFFRVSLANTYALGLNAADVTVGGLQVEGGSTSLVRERGGAVTGGAVTTFPPPGSSDAGAGAVHNAGEVVGFSRHASTGRVTGVVAVVSEPSTPGGRVPMGARLLRRRVVSH